MSKTLVKTRLRIKKPKPKIKIENGLFILPPNTQTFNQKILSGKRFFVLK